MKNFNNKKNKVNKIILASSLLCAGFSCFAASYLITNSQNSILKTGSNLNAATAVDVDTYDHTNYFQMPTTMPTGFGDYNLFATTNKSQLVQTSLGILGISNDQKTFYFTSYSGKIIWAQQFNENSLVKKFYSTNSWDLTTSLPNLKIKEWLVADVTKNVLVVLLGDGTNSFITCISLDTGMFYPSTDTTAYTISPANIFVSLGSDIYTTLNKFAAYIFVTKDYDSTEKGKMVELTSTALKIYKSDITLTSLANSLSGKKIVNFIWTDNYLFAYSIDQTSTTGTDGKYHFKQYLTSVAFSANFGANTTFELSTDFISTSSTLDTSGYKSTFFVNKNTTGTNVIFLDGNQGYNHLNICTFTSATNKTQEKTLSLEENTVSSIAISSDFNTLYLSNSESNNNIYLSYVDLTQTNLAISTIRQSTEQGNKNYFLVPVLSYTNSEYLLLQDNSKTAITYLLNSNGNYTTTNLNATYNYYSLVTNITSKTTIWDAFGNNYLPSGLTDAVLSPYITKTNMGTLLSTTFKADAVDDNNGTLKFSYTFSYRAAFLTTTTETFTIYFYVNNLYGFTGNFVFNWLDSTTTVTTENQAKINKINELKSSKYANEITAQDIIDNFISYDIKGTAGTAVTIDTSCVTLKYSDDLSNLDVVINLPTTGMPVGFANSQNRTKSYSYSGFMSIGDCTISKKTVNELASFTSTIFPSQLTSQDIFNKFITIGSGFTSPPTINDFSITISNVDDIKGTVSVSLSGNLETLKTKIDNYDSLPDDVKNLFSTVIDNVTYSGFKALDVGDAFNAIPSMVDFSNDYLPSEIWGQYEAFLAGEVQQNEVLLLQNLGFSLTNKLNLLIDCLNQETCDNDKFLKLEFTIKEGSETTIDYAGTQFNSSNGKLVFDSTFLSSGFTYPYVVNWNIQTNNKYFIIIDQNNNTEIISNDNTYSFDMKQNCPFSFADGSFNCLASQITEEDIASLINTEGFEYTISLESNESKGYLVARVDLTLTTPPLYQGSTSTNNYVKTLYLYNFNIPMPQTTKQIITISASISLAIVVGVLLWYIAWKYKLAKYKKNSFVWDEKEKDNLVLKHLKKKNSFYKEEDPSKKRND